MRISISAFIFILLFSCASFAQDELAPGYDACMKKVETFEDETHCAEKAHLYQSRRLTDIYKKVRLLCEQQENNAQAIQQCKEELKKLERSWLDFQKRTYVYLLNEGIFGPYGYNDKQIKESYKEQIPRAKRNAEDFAARETKRQADRLELFYKLWERWQ